MNTLLDFSPSLRPDAAGAVGAYVALEMTHGRTISDAVADPVVQSDYDEHPFLLDELAADPAVRAALGAA